MEKLLYTYFWKMMHLPVPVPGRRKSLKNACAEITDAHSGKSRLEVGVDLVSDRVRSSGTRSEREIWGQGQGFGA